MTVRHDDGYGGSVNLLGSEKPQVGEELLDGLIARSHLELKGPRDDRGEFRVEILALNPARPVGDPLPNLFG
jgi:hypothetical protein